MVCDLWSPYNYNTRETIKMINGKESAMLQIKYYDDTGDWNVKMGKLFHIHIDIFIFLYCVITFLIEIVYYIIYKIIYYIIHKII